MKLTFRNNLEISLVVKVTFQQQPQKFFLSDIAEVSKRKPMGTIPAVEILLSD